jgi:hypothetical protein
MGTKLLRSSCLIVILASVAAGTAIAQPRLPFVGHWQWEGPETCAPNYDGENRALEITNDTLIFEESECAARRVRKLEYNSYRLDLVCRGEGETNRRPTMLTLLPKSKVNDEMLLRIELKNGFAMAYRRCP